MINRVRAAFTEGRWWQSWKVLIGFATLYVVVSIAIAVIGISTIDPDQGHAGGFAALAFMLFVGVAVISFVAAVIFGYLLRLGRAKNVVAVLLMVGGLFVYWSSGWFELFLPVFLGATISGVLGLYEENIRETEPGRS